MGVKGGRTDGQTGGMAAEWALFIVRIEGRLLRRCAIDRSSERSERARWRG